MQPRCINKGMTMNVRADNGKRRRSYVVFVHISRTLSEPTRAGKNLRDFPTECRRHVLFMGIAKCRPRLVDVYLLRYLAALKTRCSAVRRRAMLIANPATSHEIQSDPGYSDRSALYFSPFLFIVTPRESASRFLFSFLRAEWIRGV